VVRATRVSAAAAIAADAHAAFDGIFKGKLLNIKLAMRARCRAPSRVPWVVAFAHGMR
jgi:hypothetical protein